VVKSNKVIEARYKLSVREQQIILALISMIKPTDKDFHTYRFTIKELMELTGVKNKNSYAEIKNIIRDLGSKFLTIKEPTGDLTLWWLSSAKYWDGEGRVDLEISPKLRPYLLAVKSRYTQYQLKNVVRLKSAYSIRVYELLKQYEATDQKKRVFQLEELREMLGVPESKFKLYGDFKRYVLERAKKELPKKTDLKFDYRPIKTGRKVTSIKFIIKSKGKSAPPTLTPGMTLQYKDQTHTLDETLCFPYNGGCIATGDIIRLIATGEMEVIVQ
jgi:plasmid replication initiation protein